MKETTLKLINSAHIYSCHYSNGLSNHLPMALFSLEQIGASEEQINYFHNFYVKKLEPIQATDENISDLSVCFGKPEYFHSMTKYFQNQTQKNDLFSILNKYIPKLAKGVSGAAFHPLIRLAFAIEMNNRNEISHSLASWVISYQELEGDALSNSSLTLGESLKSLQSSFRGSHHNIEGYGVFRRMLSISQKKEFASFLNSFDINDLKLDKMANILIKMYLASKDNFTALHTVTSCHALRTISGYLNTENKNVLFKYYWQAIGAAYIDSGLNDINDITEFDVLPNWSDIKDIACSSKNNHVIKFVYTCKEEFKNYSDNLYQLAAAKKVRLI